MAVAHAVYLYNHVPQTGLGICLADLFTCTQWEQCKFHDCHMWGCPVYVLDKHLLDGKKIPHWKSYSKHLIYMGNSPMHASMVPLILNPDTGALLSAFHVVFDDWFTTIPLPESHEFSPDLWEKLFGKSCYQYIFDDDDDDDDDEEDYPIKLSEPFNVDDLATQDRVGAVQENFVPASPLPMLLPVASLPLDSDSSQSDCVGSVPSPMSDDDSNLDVSHSLSQSPGHPMPVQWSLDTELGVVWRKDMSLL